MMISTNVHFFFFFNDTATTEIYTLSLHDALPICGFVKPAGRALRIGDREENPGQLGAGSVLENIDVDRTKMQRAEDRKSTRLNSSHLVISYAVFCLKKKKSYVSDLLLL